MKKYIIITTILIISIFSFITSRSIYKSWKRKEYICPNIAGAVILDSNLSVELFAEFIDFYRKSTPFIAKFDKNIRELKRKFSDKKDYWCLKDKKSRLLFWGINKKNKSFLLVQGPIKCGTGYSAFPHSLKNINSIYLVFYIDINQTRKDIKRYKDVELFGLEYIYPYYQSVVKIVDKKNLDNIVNSFTKEDDFTKEWKASKNLFNEFIKDNNFSGKNETKTAIMGCNFALERFLKGAQPTDIK